MSNPGGLARPPARARAAAAADIQAHADFLSAAAHLMAATEPATSAHLMAQRRRMLDKHGIELTVAQSERVCGGCGQIQVPGQSCSLTIEPAYRRGDDSRRKRTRQSRQLKHGKPNTPPSAPPAGPRKRIVCGRCQQVTIVPISDPPAGPRIGQPSQTRAVTQSSVDPMALDAAPHSNPSIPAAAAPPSLPVEALPASGRQLIAEAASAPRKQTGAANASSKKRAKARKTGLQALLERSSGDKSATPGGGLSLADFMKK